MNSKLIAILILTLMSIMLSSCQPQGDGFEVDYTSGNDRVAGKIIDLPVAPIRKGEPFKAHILIENEGAYDIEENSLFATLSYDRLYFSLDHPRPLETYSWVVDKRLKGRSLAYPEGGFAESPVLNFKANDAVNIATDSTFKINLCYPYRTNESTSACIGRTSGTAACNAGEFNLELGSGQGSPLAITSIKEQLISAGENKIIPRFTFEISNQKSGEVFRLVDNSKPPIYCSNRKDFKPAELQQNILDNFDFKIKLGANLIHDSMNNEASNFHCPPKARLEGNSVTITCTLKEPFAFDAQSSFLTPLHIELVYGYSEKMPEQRVRITNK